MPSRLAAIPPPLSVVVDCIPGWRRGDIFRHSWVKSRPCPVQKVAFLNAPCYNSFTVFALLRLRRCCGRRQVRGRGFSKVCEGICISRAPCNNRERWHRNCMSAASPTDQPTMSSRSSSAKPVRSLRQPSSWTSSRDEAVVLDS